MTRIIHFSDIHFSKIIFNPTQFFSKRWIGNANLIFSRKRTLIQDHLAILPEFFSSLSIDTVIFTGDASTTGSSKELEKAAQFFQKIEEKGIKVLTLPGNHDHYTKKDYEKQTFYRFFPPEKDQVFSLKKNCVETRSLSDHWQYVGLDTVRNTPFYSSQGIFSEAVEENLKNLLKTLPDKPIFLANHFPFFPFDHPRNILVRGDSLEKIIAQDPRIKIYAHGHTHRQCLADLREDPLGIVLLDSGSIAHKERGSFHLYELKDHILEVTVYRTSPKGFVPFKNTRFHWNVN